MRYRDLIALSGWLATVIVFGIVFLLPTFAAQFGFGLFFGVLLLAPILYAMLTPLNNRLRQRRKEQGRDIEEEERYETEDGMIRLTPNEPIPRTAYSPLLENRLYVPASKKNEKSGDNHGSEPPA
jgi:hypothetical protein